MINFQTIIDNWKDKTKVKLFFITNSGCDDSTHGLAELTYNEFIKFNEIIDNLNSNSTYSCMPTINCEETEWRFFMEYDERRRAAKDKDDWEFVESEKFPLNGKVYTYSYGFDEYNVNHHAPMRVYYLPPDELNF